MSNNIKQFIKIWKPTIITALASTLTITLWLLIVNIQLPYCMSLVQECLIVISVTAGISLVPFVNSYEQHKEHIKRTKQQLI